MLRCFGVVVAIFLEASDDDDVFELLGFSGLSW